MRFCKHCGNEIGENTKFCNYCGQALTVKQQPNQEELPVEPVTQESKDIEEQTSMTPQGKEIDAIHEAREDTVELEAINPYQMEKLESAGASSEIDVASNNVQEVTNNQSNDLYVVPKKSASKKTKILLFTSIAIIILLFAAFKIGESITSPKHILNDFETALEEKDVKKLVGLVTSSNKKLEITEESMAAFIKLYESNQINHVMGHLRSQADGTSSLTNISPVDLIKKGKRLVVFDDYQIVFHPVTIQIGTNYKGTDILVNGEKVATTNTEYANEEIGPFLPGEYTVQAVLDTGFFHLANEKQVKAMDSNFPAYVDLHLEGENVSFDLYSNKYDELNAVKLYVNGKETGWDLKKDYRVGPLLTDGSMNASFEADFPWGTLRTDDIPIDTTYMEFNFGNSDAFRQSLMDLIVLFNEEFIEAYTGADPTILSTTTPALQEAIMEEIISNIYAGAEYEGAFHGVDFYLDSFLLKHSYDGYWMVAVDTVTYFEEAFYQADGKKAKLEQIEEEMRYELAFDPQQKEWVVTSIDYAGSMDENRMERYKVAEPVLFSSNWAKMAEEAVAELDEEDEE